MKIFKLFTFIISIVLIGCINFSYGKVYRYEQPNGTILLTDNLQKGAELVDVNENYWTSSTSQRPDVQKILDESRTIAITGNETPKTDNNQKISNKKDLSLQNIEILYPNKDAYIRNGLGELIVKTNAELLDGQGLMASIDGTIQDQLYDNSSFLLKGLDRGEHILIVSIVTKKDQTIVTASDPVKFFMNRNIIRQNRPLPAQ